MRKMWVDPEAMISKTITTVLETIVKIEMEEVLVDMAEVEKEEVSEGIVTIKIVTMTDTTIQMTTLEEINYNSKEK